MKTKKMKEVSKNVLTNREVSVLQTKLYNVSDLAGTKFAYSILKNRKLVDAYLNKLKEKIAPSAAYNAYDKERMELAQSMAKKDEKGNPMVVRSNGGSEYDIEDKKSFEKSIKELQKKHKTAISARKKQVDAFNKLFDAPSTIKLHLIDPSEIPSDMTANQLDGISALINE